MLALVSALVLFGQFKLPEKLTYGELRALLPVELRAEPGDPKAWKLLQMVEKAGFGAKDQISPLLAEWRGKEDPTLLARSHRALVGLKPNLARLEKALALGPWAAPFNPAARYPIPPDYYPDHFDIDAALKLGAKAWVLAAFAASKEGNATEALRYVRLSRAVGEKCSNSGSSIIDFLVGGACQAIADDGARRLATKPSMSKDQVALLARSTSKFDNLAALRNCSRGDFDRSCLVLVGIVPSQMSEPRPKWINRVFDGHPNLFNARETLMKAVEIWEAALENTRRPWGKQVDPAGVAREFTSVLPKEFAGLYPEGPPPASEAQLKKIHDLLRKIDNPIGRVVIDSMMIGSGNQVMEALQVCRPTAADRPRHCEQLLP
ncbi:hypothetical protein [Fimbriimonas ginsengisoli]|uniref:Uncharacterized protein n=1 Tax=Fimbriimonas ginsengisoli Gsoil 348 TaxID=661478 RepID=A0A068NMK7_FIMGI|nr:hypothetical protein [Fimbriimonas ginsengisoli]AIE84612.1 hypothetical protein OP10G_1244 [Fimbriimonas ginsengisoli Gsoil 348]